MDSYVGVTNDASLAVKSVLQMKKAFWKQVKCNDELSKQNKTLQNTITQLEVRNKELYTFAAVLTQNKDLKNKVTKLESDNEKQGHIVSDFISQNNVDGDHDHPTSPAQPMDANTNGKVSQVCPTTPPTVENKTSKRKSTPKKITRSRKSRRISPKNKFNGSV